MSFLSFCVSVCPHDILSQQSVLKKARLRAGYKYGLSFTWMKNWAAQRYGYHHQRYNRKMFVRYFVILPSKTELYLFCSKF